MSRSDRISVIVSIHQPNNDLFNSFDFVYVLAKGGVSLFSGQPIDLKNCLKECDITLPEEEAPIEELIKISYNRFNDEKFRKLVDKIQNTIINIITWTQRRASAAPYSSSNFSDLDRTSCR